MAIEFKDYYQILGVARGASSEEIRKAFRRLARQCHPDVAQHRSGAELQFKELNEAYEVLGDPDKRRRYDALFADWRTGREFRPHGTWGPNPAGNGCRPPPSQQGAGFEFRFGGTGFSDFFEQIFGAMNGRARPSADRQSEPSHTNGTGRGEDVQSDIVVSLREVLRGSTRPITIQRTRACQPCRGSGYIHQVACPVCRGQGQTKQIERYQVKVPAGIREGQRLRLPGQGDPGTGNNPPGDLYLRVRFERHPDFRVENDHLIYDLDLAPWEAVLGTQATIPTLDGCVNIRIPPGAQNAQRFRLRGHGLPTQEGNRGDLFAMVRIQVPLQVDDRERHLWEKLARSSSFNARVR